MSEPITGDRPTTDEEVARLREENLRLRDLLIAKDAELGSLKGQVAALEAGTGRIRSLIPGPVAQALASVLRRLLPRG